MILEARQLGKSYKKRRVIKDVSLSVSSGEIVGILGPNGAGKTTTFYMIMGSIQPDMGSIMLGNVDITPLPMYQRARLGMSYLPQEPSIFRGLNVEENIMAVLEIVESDQEQRMHRLEELLGDFSISHLRYAEALSLSGGERRRVEIARALATNPKFILMDEPLAGIDPIAVSEIKELIMKLKQKGIGVLVTDHNVRETLSIVDKAYIIHDGIVFAQGSAKEIIKDKRVKEIYLGDTFK